MQPKVLYHVTERSSVPSIQEEGFRGSYASLGDGVYFFGGVDSALAYARRRGWDGRLTDPVVLAIRDEGPRKVMPSDLSATQDYRVYEDVWYVFVEEDCDDRFRPETLWVAVDRPRARKPEILSEPPRAAAPPEADADEGGFPAP